MPSSTTAATASISWSTTSGVCSCASSDSTSRRRSESSRHASARNAPARRRLALQRRLVDVGDLTPSVGVHGNLRSGRVYVHARRDARRRPVELEYATDNSTAAAHSADRFDQSSSRLRRCLAVYLPTLLPSAVPTSVLLRQCIPPHTRALPSSAWISATLV